MNRKVTIKPFEIEDLKLMKLKEKPDKQKLKKIMGMGNSGTIIYGREILGAMGYYKMWNGVCEVWCFYNEESNHDGVFMLILRDDLTELAKKFHRIQATGLKTDIGSRFFRQLGFKSEGILKKYSTSGQDYLMWARTE